MNASRTAERGEGISLQRNNLGSPYAYPDTRSFVEGMKRQALGDYSGQSYPRSGFPELGILEKRVARLIGLGDGYLYLTNSGMSAAVTAVEVAAPTRGDFVIHGSVEYSKADTYFEKFLGEKRGAAVIQTNPGDVESMDRAFQGIVTANPRASGVVFLETVGNGPGMPVLELDKFLKLQSLRKFNPLIVLDNTLPTNSVIPVTEYARDNPELKIVGLESATKFYISNQGLCGFVYTHNEEIRRQLLQNRTVLGSTPDPAAIDLFLGLVPDDKDKFGLEIRRTMRNTLILAQACAEVGSGRVSVCYPNLKNHPNYQYAKENFPEGIAPVFFLQPLATGEISSEEVFNALGDVGAFEGMMITESFGFGGTAVSHSARLGGSVRIAGGLESESKIEKIAESLQKGLASI